MSRSESKKALSSLSFHQHFYSISFHEHVLSRHLNVITSEHARIRRRHEKALDKAGGEPIHSLDLEHLDVFQLDSTRKEIMTQLASTKGQQAREHQANLFTQLALVFMDRMPHYHHRGLYSKKAHESWMPAYQGVHFNLIQSPVLKTCTVLRCSSTTSFRGSPTSTTSSPPTTRFPPTNNTLQ